MIQPLLELEPLVVQRSEYREWRTGTVAKEWAARYPSVFDADDLRLALVRCAQGRHYFEWAAARHLHHVTGFNALVCKYEFAAHRTKRAIVERLIPSSIDVILRDRTKFGSAQAPDLLMYAPDFTSYFFCEVKGPTDRIRKEQARKFSALAKAIRQPVHMIHVRWDNRESSVPPTV
jgi:hypothetical protein